MTDTVNCIFCRNDRMKVDSKLKPYMVPSIEEEKLESGGVSVSLRIDESDKDKIPQIIAAKIRRTAKMNSQT